MDFITVIIPTLQKNKNILDNLVRECVSDNLVQEIIIIDNSKRGYSFNSEKVRVIVPDVDLYVNPAWNLGVKEAKTEYFALLNDDIFMPQNLIKQVIGFLKSNSNAGVIGVGEESVINKKPTGYDTYPEDSLIKFVPVKKNNTHWGCAIFGQKSTYKPIPEDIKIWFGDDYYIYENLRNNNPCYKIMNGNILHFGGMTSKEIVFSQTKINDAQLYLKINPKHKKNMSKGLLKTVKMYKQPFYKKIFSVENEINCDRKYKIITLLGIKIEFDITKSNVRVYDCFTYFNEQEILEIRLNTLKDVVDKFVIVESRKTHSGQDKALNFDINKFPEFKDKIIYEVFDDYPPFENAWIYENMQRNHIFNVLERFCKKDDVVIISDVDEIPNPETVRYYLKKKTGIMSLEQKFYYYFINMINKTTPKWYFAKILRFSDFFSSKNDNNYSYSIYLPKKINQGITPNKIRMMQNLPVLKNGGWHFSYLGGIDRIIEKIQNFAHQEFNNAEVLSRENLVKRIQNGDDILGRGYEYRAVKLDKMFPSYILKNQQQFSKLIFEITPEYKRKIAVKNIKKALKKVYSKTQEANHNVFNILGIKIKFRAI